MLGEQVKRLDKMKTTDTIEQHKHVVFCIEHYNPLGLVRSLGESGIYPDVIILQSSRKLTSQSKYVKHCHYVESIEAGYDYLLKNYGHEAKRSFVYTADDQITNFMDSKYEDLKNRFYFYNAGRSGRIAEFQNKDRILQIAHKYGLQYLKTFAVNVGEFPEGLEYPIITKAIISTIDNWKGDMFICHDESELREAYKHIRSPRVLLQKYIEKKNELCLEGVSVNCGRNVLISIASHYNYLLKDSYSPFMTVQNLHNQKVENSLKQMFNEIGFEGIFEVEFLVDKEGRLYFLEINFRNSTWSYASTIAGMPLPIIWAKGMLDPTILARSYREIKEPFWAMVEFDDFVKRVKRHQVTFGKWFSDFKRCKCKYYWGRNDPRPFFSMFESILASKWHRIIIHK